MTMMELIKAMMMVMMMMMSPDADFLHIRDSSPVKNGFSHIDPMLEVTILTYITILAIIIMTTATITAPPTG